MPENLALGIRLLLTATYFLQMVLTVSGVGVPGCLFWLSTVHLVVAPFVLVMTGNPFGLIGLLFAYWRFRAIRKILLQWKEGADEVTSGISRRAKLISILMVGICLIPPLF